MTEVKKENPETQEAQLFKTTQYFIDLLKEKDWNFRLIPHDENRKNDRVIVPMSSKNLPSIPVQVFFSPDEERIAIYVYNIHTVVEDKLPIVPKLICDLQDQFIFARWGLDRSDNTIQAEWFGNVTGGAETGEICLTGVKRMASVVDDCFPLIMQAMYALPTNLVSEADLKNSGSTIVS